MFLALKMVFLPDICPYDGLTITLLRPYQHVSTNIVMLLNICHLQPYLQPNIHPHRSLRPLKCPTCKANALQDGHFIGLHSLMGAHICAHMYVRPSCAHIYARTFMCAHVMGAYPCAHHVRASCARTIMRTYYHYS